MSIEVSFLSSDSQFQGVLSLINGQLWGQNLAWKTVAAESFGSLCVAQSALKIVETWSELLSGGKFNLAINSHLCPSLFFLCYVCRMVNILIQNNLTQYGHIPDRWLSQLANCACSCFSIWGQILLSFNSHQLKLFRLKSPIFVLGLRSLNFVGVYLHLLSCWLGHNFFLLENKMFGLERFSKFLWLLLQFWGQYWRDWIQSSIGGAFNEWSELGNQIVEIS